MILFKKTADEVSKKYLKTAVELDTLSLKWSQESKNLNRKACRMLETKAKVLRFILSIENKVHEKVSSRLAKTQQLIDSANNEAVRCHALATNFKNLLGVSK